MQHRWATIALFECDQEAAAKLWDLHQERPLTPQDVGLTQLMRIEPPGCMECGTRWSGAINTECPGKPSPDFDPIRGTLGQQNRQQRRRENRESKKDHEARMAERKQRKLLGLKPNQQMNLKFKSPDGAGTIVK